MLGKPLSTLLAGAIAVLLLSSALYLTGLADVPFYTKGEPREALVVWEMTHGSSLVLPLRNGSEIPSKPPFFHWLALLVALVRGVVDELGMRLPSALLAIATVLGTYLFGATTGRLRSGWLAAVALMFSFEWLRAARVSRVDMTLAFFLCAALLCFAIMQRSGVTRARLWIFYASIAAATLGKGPVGIALPAFVILAFAFTSPLDPATSGPGTTWIGRMAARVQHTIDTGLALRPVQGLGAVLLVVGGWYAAAWVAGGNDFFVKHVLKENLFRVIDPDALDTGHEHGPLYLLPNFLVGALPWSLLAPAIAWWLWRMRPLDGTTRYLVVWFLGTIVFYSIPASKRSVYILPAYPAGALLLGLVLGPGPEGEGPRKLAGWALSASAAVTGVAGVLILLISLGLPVEAIASPFLQPKDLQGLHAALVALREQTLLVLGASLAMLAGAAVTWREAPGAHWLRASVGFAVALLALYAGVVGPVERGVAGSRSLRPFMAEVRARTHGAELGFLCTFDYGAVFYSHRHIRALLGDDACRDASARAEAITDPKAPPYVLMGEDEATRLGDRVEVVLLSDGTGPQGRQRMALASPRRGAAAPASGDDAPADPSAGDGADTHAGGAEQP
ncbi:MAG: phospholipid carrier-dependent glycosyltransferase [Deltaproteobacteria bacterium]|nr:phospholipid carrier-dependent glycosyltransferase [Deltaproteobacteria bacterium]